MLTIDLVAASGLEFLDILAAKFSDEAIEVNELLLPKSWTIFHHQLTLVFDKQFVIIMGNNIVSTLPFWRNFFLRKSKLIQTFTGLVITKRSIMRGREEHSVEIWTFFCHSDFTWNQIWQFRAFKSITGILSHAFLRKISWKQHFY